ncbi:DNA-directed RNA polymerase subunit alpha [Helicobacter mustelae]|uniref:DNA-directed RNA polymerase subunit alpha n=1 Tax=Helicobacter mustelae (strain ATCC 43772 / CCUG 25715 / CIP 103759 / LMG 18044 / NCTC 12198 / R85-136P) TaxID=679897 RepID=D3UIG3_HELM1|nr:DNA-directed RNA polymerase subunit alpha [Helicobacter mustelae]CBG40286.1 DNA-directed RNA polymerase alpha chain [Helicobacter mustelae 12198]SQH71786.1 DNA-directed RNA polymerase subunit alpha [Helicobacter mustelae]STP12915.1 DNA-directed RNA polymerase subunit alpha [Helicobacter mustelae]
MKVIKTTPYIPTTVDVEELGPNKVRVMAYPFESGYAVTLAHPLRRLLLSSSVGLAPIALKIEGVAHEFDSIRGIVEDVSPFIVNLKNIRFLGKEGGFLEEEKVELHYSFQGPMVLSGGHLANDQIDIVNKEAPLATINEDAVLNFSIIVQKGIGYVPSEDIRGLISEDYIPLDAYFTPVRKAVYEIENVLVEDNPTYEKIIFDVETDGQVDPYEAFKQAIAIMYSQMSIFNADISSISTTQKQAIEDNFDFKDLLMKIDSLNLNARCFNCLDRIGIRYVGELVLMSESEIKGVKNLGKTSYNEIVEKLQEIGYPIGTELEEDKKIALTKKISKLKA